MVVKYTGLMDTIWALILPGAVQVFNMLVVMNYMRSLPKELEEAAYIDGAGHFQTLFNVILPSVRRRSRRSRCSPLSGIGTAGTTA